jgi:hypothetical protein
MKNEKYRKQKCFYSKKSTKKTFLNDLKKVFFYGKTKFYFLMPITVAIVAPISAGELTT